MKCEKVLVISLVGMFGISTTYAAEILSPGIYALEDLLADPEPITVTVVGTDDFDHDTFRVAREETYNLAVFELMPGYYRFVNNPAAKTDQAVLNAEANGFNLGAVAANSGADGVLLRGLGSYPGETAISFGLINVFPEVPRLPNGDLDVERAAGEIGYQFFTGQNYFDINGTIGVFENLSIGDHANNNTGAIRTRNGGITFMHDVWVYNVYDGVFINDSSQGYFFNCIFHQSYQPWIHIDDARADGYFTEEWDAFVTPNGLQDSPFVEGLDSIGVFITEEQYPHTRGVVFRNDIAWGFNITLIQTRVNPNLQSIYMKNCTLVKHIVRDTNITWRHLPGDGVFALLEDCMILNLNTSPNTQIRFDTGGDDFFGSMYNVKFWNYGGEDANVTGLTPNWIVVDADSNTPGGLAISDVYDLVRLDGRNLTTFHPDSIELTMASDGGQVGYRLPETAPAGPLPVVDGTPPVDVSHWMLH